MATTLYLMRHGEVHNPTQILYGRLPDFFLSDEGIRQAHAAGEWLKDKNISHIYCSPMDRTKQTAGIVAEYQTDLTPEVDERIIEIMTPHEGRPIAELEAINWAIYDGNEPPYEIPETVLDRVHNFFEYLLEKHPDEAVIAVAHGDILVFPWLHAHGVDTPQAEMKDTLATYNLPEAYPATASIMTFTLTDSPRKVRPSTSYIRPY